jgi:hypothetical protein
VATLLLRRAAAQLPATSGLFAGMSLHAVAGRLGEEQARLCCDLGLEIALRARDARSATTSGPVPDGLRNHLHAALAGAPWAGPGADEGAAAVLRVLVARAPREALEAKDSGLALPLHLAAARLGLNELTDAQRALLSELLARHVADAPAALWELDKSDLRPSQARAFAGAVGVLCVAACVGAAPAWFPPLPQAGAPQGAAAGTRREPRPSRASRPRLIAIPPPRPSACSSAAARPRRRF